MRRLVATAAALLTAACTHSARPGAPTSPASTAPPRAAYPLSLFTDRPGGEPQQRGGSLTVAVPAEAPVLDTFSAAGDTPAARALAPLWLPGLWRLGPDGVRTPWLAAGRPEVHGLRVTVRLRTDARWSDGRPITSADVAATWRRAVSAPGPWRAAYRQLSAVEAPAPDRVVLVRRSSGAGWVQLFAAPTGVLPAHATGKPPGTVSGGPFVLAGRTPGLESRWVRTPHGWPGSDPALDSLVLRVVPDLTDAAYFLRLPSGPDRVDVVAPYDSARVAERLAGGDVRAVRGAGRGRVLVLEVYAGRAALADGAVRRALREGFDRGLVGTALVGASGGVADRADAASSAGARPPSASAARAAATLTSGGWRVRTGGHPRLRSGRELRLALALTQADELAAATARALQHQLFPIGVQVDAAAAEEPEAERLARADLPLALHLLDLDVVARPRDPSAPRSEVLPVAWVAPVTLVRRGVVPAPVGGPGGAFADADRWAVSAQQRGR